MLKRTQGDVRTDPANQKEGVGTMTWGIQTCSLPQWLVFINNIVNSASASALGTIREITSLLFTLCCSDVTAEV